MSWQKGRRWMGEGSSPDGHHDTWPDFKLERQHMLMGRSQERPPCVCHLATAGISGQRFSHRKEWGALLVPHPPTDVSPQFSQAADAINRAIVCNANSSHPGCSHSETQIQMVPQLLTPSKKVYHHWCQWHKPGCGGQKEGGREKCG